MQHVASEIERYGLLAVSRMSLLAEGGIPLRWLLASHQRVCALACSIILVAVIGVFCFIPFVSDFAFWFSAAAYVVLASTFHH